MRVSGPNLWMSAWKGATQLQCPLDGPAGLLLSSRSTDSAYLGLPGTLYDRRVPFDLYNPRFPGYKPYTARGARGASSAHRRLHPS